MTWISFSLSVSETWMFRVKQLSSCLKLRIMSHTLVSLKKCKHQVFSTFWTASTTAPIRAQQKWKQRVNKKIKLPDCTSVCFLQLQLHIRATLQIKKEEQNISEKQNSEFLRLFSDISEKNTGNSLRFKSGKFARTKLSNFHN